MRRHLLYAQSALRDLAIIREWLLQAGSGERARSKLAHIRSAIRSLTTHPVAWPVGEHEGVREISVEGYRIMYEVHPDTGETRTSGDVRILRVFGPGQDRTSL